jgi:hypothetical protein
MLQIIQPQKYSYGLAYPAGATPGFDQSHIASGGITNRRGFSGIATSANFVNVLNGAAGAIVNAPTSAYLGSIGPCTDYPGQGQTHCSTFAGQSTTIDAQATLAAIFQLDAVNAGTNVFFTESGNSNGGYSIGYTATGKPTCLALGGTNSISTPTLVANIPYFFAVSSQVVGGSCFFVLARLDTGQVLTETQARAVPSAGAPSGIYNVGNTTSSPRSPNAKIAAVMFSNQSISLAAIVQWAADPWSFWYPNK